MELNWPFPYPTPRPVVGRNADGGGGVWRGWQCDAALAGAVTTVEQDSEALSAARAVGDAPLVGAVEFRMQAKLLWTLARSILQRYVDVTSA